MTDLQISQPGIYTVPAEVYHRAQFLPGSSLSSTGAYKLATDCPAAFAYDRENKVHKRVFDIGTAGHLMVLEPHLFDQQVVIIQGKTKDGKPSNGYASEDAQRQRDEAYAAGKTPLLPHERDLLAPMREVLLAHPIAKNALAGKVEVERTLIWQDQEFGVWCRARPDILPKSRRWVANYKTAASAHPDDIRKSLWNQGYAQRAAWEVEAVARVIGTIPSYMLIVQEKAPPFRVTVARIAAEALTQVDPLNRKARGIFAWCTENNTWPDHHWTGPDMPLAAVNLDLPAFARSELRNQEEAGLLEPPQTISKAIAA